MCRYALAGAGVGTCLWCPGYAERRVSHVACIKEVPVHSLLPNQTLMGNNPARLYEPRTAVPAHSAKWAISHRLSDRCSVPGIQDDVTGR